MSATHLLWGAPDWQIPAGIAMVVAWLVIVRSYWRSLSPAWVRVVAGSLKALGVAALAVCLLEPLLSGVRPRPGANLFILLADNSRSLQIRDRAQPESRGHAMKAMLDQDTQWQTRLSQDFDVRRYVFDARLRPVPDYADLDLEGGASSLAKSLTTVGQRFQGRPTAGVLLFTDGNATDLVGGAEDWSRLPPVYPVVMGDRSPASDISVSRVSVSQTGFEAAPATVLAEIVCHGYDGQAIVTQLLDESGKEIARQIVPRAADGKPMIHRFQLQPETSGIGFYQVRAFAQSEGSEGTDPIGRSEATSINNRRLVMVDRGGGPYRVLYVSGRPNWEFKFLRRAVQGDDEVQLVGLVRIAKREPKFTFRGRDDERTNPIYRGFGNQEDEQAEQYDEPVFLRLGTEDEDELRDGFPKAADQLFRYHAIVLDDVEAKFFTQDQMSLIQQFVAQRGGGLLMLGGQESFVKGEYHRTPIGELLPVYVDRAATGMPDGEFRLRLTRDGWLQPWVRLRATEPEEEKRLEKMPGFKTVNLLRNIKPGATVLAHVTSQDDKMHPALVVQRFGQGRSAAVLIGDMWRWQLRRENPDDDDLQKSWRQMVRWLVADVPQRVEIKTSRKGDDPGEPIQLDIDVRDEGFAPLDNASVAVHVTTPDGRELELAGDPSDRKGGVYQASFLPPKPGAYRARVTVTAPDGSDVGQRETGWVADPAMDEFRSLTPNRPLLDRLAQATGGEVVAADQLEPFVSGLSNRKVPLVEPWVYPLWHQWTVFFFAVGCLVCEWGLRRWQGLP